MRICKYFILLFICLFSSNVYASELRISVDKNIITEGDVFKLFIHYNGDSNNNPDLSSLEKKFDIISKGSSSQISYINGTVTQSKEWQIGLKAISVGKTKINPIKLDNNFSNSLDIEVKPMADKIYVSTDEFQEKPFLKIEQEVNNKKPYIKQQIILSVTISDGLGLHNGQLNFTNTSLNDWIIIPLTQSPEIEKRKIKNNYVYEQTFDFAIFPQKSGHLKLPQAYFEGSYIKNLGISQDFSSFHSWLGMGPSDFFGQKESIRMKAKEDFVNVSPAPIQDNFWLPLSDLKLSLDSSKQKLYNVGDAISKKIVLKAYGLPKDSFPLIEFPQVERCKQYPEKPIIKQKITGNDVITIVELNTVYIPQSDGTISFPEMEIKWFNTNTKKIEISKIPAENITVFSDSKADVIKSETLENNIDIEKNSSTVVSKPETTTSDKTNYKSVVFLISGVVFIFFLITLLFIKNRKKHLWRNRVIKDILNHDYISAKKSLIEWAKFKFHKTNIRNFNDILKLIEDEQFHKQLKILNKVIYSIDNNFIDVDLFIKEFKKIDHIKIKSDKNIQILPNLYD